MYSLIFFLFNLVCVLGNYMNPTTTSRFYVNNTYEIQWNFPDVNQNLTHIFLTHGEPFKLSKFSNNQMVLADVVFPAESAYNWTLPFDLNYYNIDDIQWRILLSNSSTPYSSNIGSHSVQSIIYLSDFFSIQSNMNVSSISETNIITLDTINTFTSNGFILNSSETPIEFKFILKNTTDSIELARFSSLPFNNQYLTVELGENYTEGDYPQLYEYTLVNMENTEFFNTPILQISARQNSIDRNVSDLPIFFLRITENYVDNQNSVIQTECINYNQSCFYDLHVNHNGIENVIYNQTGGSYNLIKYSGDYQIWATFGTQSSNTISFEVTTTTMTTTPTSTQTTSQTTTPTTTSSILTTISSFYTTSVPINNVNNTCHEDDSCENSDFPLTSVIAGIFAILFFLFASYYFCKLYKSSGSPRVHPRHDLESGNNNRGRVIQNTNYESTQETSFINSVERPIDQARQIANGNVDASKPTHYYPDLDRLRIENQIVYSATENQYDEPNNSFSRRQGAYPNMIYTRTDPVFDPDYSLYYDNYGNRRPIRRRLSSSGYGYEYGHNPNSSSSQHCGNPDSHRYNHLERHATLRVPQTQSAEYSILSRQTSKEK